MQIYDISPPVTGKTALFEGEEALKRVEQCALSKGDVIDLSSIHVSVHAGAHADAPSHFSKGEPTIDQVSLEPYLGPCRVMTVRNQRLIRIQDIEPTWKEGTERVLFRTLSFANPEKWSSSFAALTSEAIDWLGKRSVKLVGIDTPSVDPADSKDLSAHHALLRWKMRNLESLRLENVKDGEYELIALPLRLVGFEASPVRAVLRDLK